MIDSGDELLENESLRSSVSSLAESLRGGNDALTGELCRLPLDCFLVVFGLTFIIITVLYSDVSEEETLATLDQTAEEEWITDEYLEANSVDDSADEVMESTSLESNVPTEDGNTNIVQAPTNHSLESNLPPEDGNTNLVQAPMNHHESQRPFLLQQQLAANPLGARYNMDALIPQANVSRHNAGSMSVTCTYCNATGFPKEKKKGKNQGVNLGRLCCTAGTSMFNNFPELPEDLMSLYTGTDNDAKYFQKHIRFFNAGMAMALSTQA
jgi:hypothetical protein